MTSPEFDDNSSESMDDDLDNLVNNMQQIDFGDPKINNKVYKMS